MTNLTPDISPEHIRWSARRKAAVVNAIRDGSLSWADAKTMYALSLEELATWQAVVAEGGPAALRAKVMRPSRRDPNRRPGRPRRMPR